MGKGDEVRFSNHGTPSPPGRCFPFTNCLREAFGWVCPKAICARRLAGSRGRSRRSLPKELQETGLVTTPPSSRSSTRRIPERSFFANPIPFAWQAPCRRKSPHSSADDWQVEWKWDGIRAQFLSTSGGSGMLWSRGEEAIEDCFPEILACLPHLPEELCLDGEILSWGHQGDCAPFPACKSAWAGRTPGRAW